jgi:branched-chain amino acid aminotransferase
VRHARTAREPGAEPVVTDAPGSVWIDGALTPVAEARVSPFDHGLLVGDGVFETLRVYRGVPFAWRRHIERLGSSASGLGLEVPEAFVLREAADAVLAANGLDEGRLRITITGGPSPLGSERGGSTPTVIVAASTARAWPPSERVVTVPWPRNERGATSGLKTISYAENVRALAYAHERDATEAIFLNTRGELCEATGSNVFVVDDSHLLTPPGDAGCLLGVTRALVLELCSELAIDVEERALPADALAGADEAFLTSSTREVQPISHVDGHELATTCGPVCDRLSKAFVALVARDLDP